MKTRFFKALMPSMALAGTTLLSGCEEETKATAATTTTNGVLAAVATNAPPPTTNLTAVSAEPVVKPITAPPSLSPGVDEIVQLAQASVGDDVLLAYIENSSANYDLKVEEILYLHDLGLSAQVVSAMVRHSQVMRDQASNASPPVVQVNPEAQATVSAQVAPTNVVTPAEPQQVTTAPVEQPPQQITYNYFHSALSPYGNWIEVPDYGWCWQPTVAVVNSGWRPYCDGGRWVWTDCGWYWQSDYSWGWAPFHYGRWHLSPACGWVWMPDNVWGPAWVTWRYSDAYCGWAPLPPRCYYDAGFGFRFRGSRVGIGFDFGLGFDCYTFIPLNRFCDRTPWHHTLPRSGIVSVFNNCTVINNYITGNNNNVIVNVGPGTRGIAAASRTEIRKVALRDVNPSSGTLIKADRLDRDGAALAVYRPKLPEQATRPPADITRRQQEVRKKSEALANSDGVKLARASSERRAVIPSQPRGSVAGSPAKLTPSTAASDASPTPEARTPRSEVRPKMDVSARGRSEPRAAVPSPGAPQTPAQVRSRSPEPTRPPAPSDNTSVRPDNPSRGVTESPGRSPEPRVTARPSTASPQPNVRREIRSEPAPRSPFVRPEQRNVITPPSQPSAPIARSAESRSQSQYTPPQSQYSPPPARPAPRVELRSYESTAPRSAPPSFTPAPSRSPSPPPQTVAPRQAPSYTPPRSEPRSSSPPPSAPRAVESPRSSSPPPSRPSPSADRPSRSEGGRRER
jgi:uncharacterized protein DUF6600